MFIGMLLCSKYKEIWLFITQSYLGIRSISSLELATFMEMKKSLIKTKTIYGEVRKPVGKFYNNFDTIK
jgi:hypothetical protein